MSRVVPSSLPSERQPRFAPCLLQFSCTVPLAVFLAPVFPLISSGNTLHVSCSPHPVCPGTQGQLQEVELVRMQSDLIADRRRLFELFTTLKDRATLNKDQLAAQVIDETISLVSLQNATSLSASYPILINRSIPGSCRVHLQDQNMSANPLAKMHR